MGFLLTKLWQGVTALWGLLVPVLRSSVAVLVSWPWWLRWLVRILVLGAIIALLFWLNDRLDLEPRLRTPLPFLRRAWLPTLFVLGYLLLVFGTWLWQLVGPEAEPSDHPDLDAAWQRGRDALDSAGLDVTRLPLFLVLGRPAAGDGGLFPHGPGGPRPLTADPSAPVRVFASADAVFVTCGGASLLAHYAEALAAEPEAGPEPAELQPEPEAAPGPVTSAMVEPIVALLLGGNQPGAAPAAGATTAAPVVPAGPRAEELLEQADSEAVDRRRDTAGARLLRDPATVARAAARVAYLGRLIAQARRPYTPVNGILLTLPYRALSGDAEAGRAAVVAQHDLGAARESLGVDCPVYAVLADLELAPGGADFVERIPPEKRSLPVGQAFPLVPVLGPQEVPARVGESLRWVADALVPMLVYAMVRLEPPGGDPFGEAAANARLVQLRLALGERLPRLGELVGRAVSLIDAGGVPRPLAYGGTFLAATGDDPSRRAFTAGVLRRLVETQNAVRWTDRTLAEEAGYRRLTVLGYAALSVALAASAGLAWWLVRTW
jgi:hypothetical protein